MLQTLRFTVLALVVLASPLLRSQQQAPPLAGIAHLAIRVRSLDAAREFYNKLGFEEAFSLKDKEGKPRESFIKINDHQFLELYPANPDVPNEAAIGFLHVCFEGDDLQAIHDDYVTHGLTPKQVRKAGAGNMLFTMAGPIDANGTAHPLTGVTWGDLVITGTVRISERASTSIPKCSIAFLK